MVELSVLEEPSALSRLEAEWYELLECSDANGPTLTPMWLLAWWRVFGAESDRMLRVCVAREDGKLVGLMPLLRRNHRYHRLLHFRRLELIGSGECESDEIASDYIGPVVAQGHEAAFADAIADAMTTGRLGTWDEVTCPRMGAWRKSVSELGRALREKGAAVELEPMGNCRYIALPTTWQAYLSSLPSQHRYVVRRALREFDKWAGSSQKLETATTRADLAKGAEILRSLHADRWSVRGRSGVFASSQFSRFHDVVMPQLLDRGALQLVWLTAKGTPVAVLYNVIWGGCVHFYQSGRRMDVPKQVRPGLTLHAMAIRQSIEKGLSEYDFLAGESLYKAQLCTHARQLVYLRATPHGSVREGIRRVGAAGLGAYRTMRAAVRGRG